MIVVPSFSVTVTFLVENGLTVSNNNTKVKDWTEKAITLYKTKQSDLTREKFERRIDHCILKYIGDMKIGSVTPVKLQEIMNYQKGKSPTQVKEVYNGIKFIFSTAYRNELIVKDPSANLVMPQTSQIKTRRALTPAERAVFVDVGLSKNRYLPFMLMLFCGCRPSEAIRVTPEDFQIIDGYQVLHIKGTKTARSDRYVPVNDELYSRRNNLPEIKDLRPVWKAYKRDINIALGCKVFRNKLIEPLPLADDIVPYCLRHEFCTDLARRGIDIRVAQRLMGHSDITMTANIYTNLTHVDTFRKLEEQGHTQGHTSK